MEAEKDMKIQKELLNQQLQAYQRLAESVKKEKSIRTDNEVNKFLEYKIKTIKKDLNFINAKEKIFKKYKKIPLAIQCGKYFYFVIRLNGQKIDCKFYLNEEIEAYLSYIWPYYPEEFFYGDYQDEDYEDEEDEKIIYYNYREYENNPKIQMKHTHEFKYEVESWFDELIRKLLVPFIAGFEDDLEEVPDIINFVENNKELWKYVDDYIVSLISDGNEDWHEKVETVYKRLQEYEKNLFNKPHSLPNDISDICF